MLNDYLFLVLAYQDEAKELRRLQWVKWEFKKSYRLRKMKPKQRKQGQPTGKQSMSS